MAIKKLGWALGATAFGCSSGELGDDMPSNEDEIELGVIEQALTNNVAEFPFRVIPIKFRYVSAAVPLCLEVEGASQANDANIITDRCYSSRKHQDWFLVQLKDNSYQIRTGHSGGKLLSIRNASTSVGAEAQTYDITSSPNTRWDIIKRTDGLYALKNYNSQLCLSLYGTQIACSNADAGVELVPKYQFPFSIVAKHSGKCLNVAGASTSNNANVQQYPCVGAENERWYLTPNSVLNPTYFEFKAAHSGKCLDIAGGSLSNNGNAQQYDCIGVTNEHWTVHSAGEGYFYIKNVNSGKCLTVAGASTSTNANVDQYTCVNADNQKWRWNYFIERHVQWVNAKNASGGGTNITGTQFTNNFNVARQLFAPYGVNLVHTAASDRVQVNAAAHHSDVDTATWCPEHQATHKASVCAGMITAEYPDKLVAITALAAGSSGDTPYAFLLGNGFDDRCPAPADTCGTSNDNVAHVAHELGHFFGLQHTFGTSGDGDEWLADTATDDSNDLCLSRTSNPPAVGNNVMSYMVPCTPEISPMQGAILKAAAYARYSDGIR